MIVPFASQDPIRSLVALDVKIGFAPLARTKLQIVQAVVVILPIIQCVGIERLNECWDCKLFLL